MARLLPSQTDHTTDQQSDPSVLYVDNDQTETVISTLSGDTAMTVFRMLTDEALTASEVADRLDLSVQNASYHLENLQEANLVEVVDTCYSEKGREMQIYAVSREPKVLVLGPENDQNTIRRAFGQLAGVVGVPAVLIAGWQALSGVFETLLET